MRLMESMHYKGRRIRIYLLRPEGDVSRPTLGVQVDEVSGPPHSRWAVLPDVRHLDEAVRWGRTLVDRAERRAWRVVRRIRVRHHHVLKTVL